MSVDVASLIMTHPKTHDLHRAFCFVGLFKRRLNLRPRHKVRKKKVFLTDSQINDQKSQNCGLIQLRKRDIALTRFSKDL
jgi:hypothetical protein